MIQKQTTFAVYDYEGNPIVTIDSYSDAMTIFSSNNEAAYFVASETVNINGKQVYAADRFVRTRNDFEEEIECGTIILMSDAGEKFSVAPDGTLTAG
ncbi:hypothetical protein [Paenibacillus rubinfantis]|uniref:hypothetical protein n=1 Tax=Paenibacillus rubinfantis TaxID=1720296 RepID=UPI00073E42BC|nr:hypothetical protein [Paenibacillus rubinfantis]